MQMNIGRVLSLVGYKHANEYWQSSTRCGTQTCKMNIPIQSSISCWISMPVKKFPEFHLLWGQKLQISTSHLNFSNQLMCSMYGITDSPSNFSFFLDRKRCTIFNHLLAQQVQEPDYRNLDGKFDVPLTILKDAKVKYSVIDGTPGLPPTEHVLGSQLTPEHEI